MLEGAKNVYFEKPYSMEAVKIERLIFFGFGCMFVTGMVIYSRLIKPGRTAEMLPPWRYCMFRNCLIDVLRHRPAPFTPIKGRITHLYNCCNLIPQDWLMSQW